MNLSRLGRFTALLLVASLLSHNFAFASKKPADPAAMKVKIQARGVGQGVRVTLANQTEAKGIIVAVNEQSFLLKSKQMDQPQEVDYAQITGVHNDRLSRGQKVAIAVGIVAGAAIITGITLTVKFDHSKIRFFRMNQ